MKRRDFLQTLAAAAAYGSAGTVRAQAYPTKPVRIIAPFGAGGGGDTTIRMLAQQLGQSLGQQFVVENKPGGNGVIGVQEALRGGADGYTLFYGSTTTLAANATLLKKMSYDPVKDFAPISRVGVLPFMLVVRADQPFQSVKDVIDHAKANPGKLSYASANATGQVSGASFCQLAGIDMLHVPYKATTAGVTDVLNGNVTMIFVDIPPAIGQVMAGKFRVLGVTTAKRTPLLPQVPAISESLPAPVQPLWPCRDRRRRSQGRYQQARAAAGWRDHPDDRHGCCNRNGTGPPVRRTTCRLHFHCAES